MDDPIKLVLERYGPVNKDMLLELQELFPNDQLPDSWLVDNEKMRLAIVHAIVPAVVGRWLQKNEDYRGAQMFLGLRAQFIDINRKFWKLYHMIWEAHKPKFEQPVEIEMDMIGHLLMAIYLANPEYWHNVNLVAPHE